ncbi:hypothetical protein Zmor_018154 [Zophobas morio]|uniref:FLYWCH-type domain-containing protein n=1 Tax=Zophobas morio TaxID=2755281 RepID=A0AA38ICV4_9CUCU|nr:hypothetical protein Zmor_018154 [Zophobas morio]
MEFAKSQKGGRILFYGGYRYRKDKENIHSVSWRCSQEGWKGRLLVSENSSEPTSTTAHSHGSDSAKREVGRVRQSMRELAETSKTKANNSNLHRRYFRRSRSPLTDIRLEKLW